MESNRRDTVLIFKTFLKGRDNTLSEIVNRRCPEMTLPRDPRNIPHREQVSEAKSSPVPLLPVSTTSHVALG